MKSALPPQENVYNFTNDLLESARLLIDAKEAYQQTIRNYLKYLEGVIKRAKGQTIKNEDYLNSMAIMATLIEDRENILEARKKMKTWKNSKNQVIKKIVAEFIESTDTCLLSIELMEPALKELIETPLAKHTDAMYNLDLAVAKRKRCVLQIIDMTSNFPDLYIKQFRQKLSKDEAKTIIEITDILFEKELAAFRKKSTVHEVFIPVLIKKNVEVVLELHEGTTKEE
jgi:hypothetical protein